MTITKAIELFKEYQKVTLKSRTRTSYERLLEKLQVQFSGRQVDSITSEDISRFLEQGTEGLSRSTKRLRYSQLKAFFNHVIDSSGMNIKNPCNSPLLLKAFRNIPHKPRKILDKETVDEMIFSTKSARDRLILELQARCGLRVGEVLKLRGSDVSGRKLLIEDPKSGGDVEVAFMPEHIATRLAEYIASENISSTDRVFSVCYTTVRNIVGHFGRKINLRISPHDLRRHSATYASRNGVPLEIISKVILRHQDLKTTQVYLGKVSDTEAIRWMDILHGK
jgi:integrase/recombinase XerD